jgi:hypothetical protein
MNNAMVPTEQITDRARSKARNVLGGSAAFQSMPLSEQKSIYLSLVQEYVDDERDKLGFARPMATDSGKQMGYKGYDPGFGGDTAAFNELVDSVDFPKFVADLLKAVFDANLKVMKTQTDSYIKLMKECTKSTADFVKKVKDDDPGVFLKLAETQGDKYNIISEKGTDGSSKLALTTKDGDKVVPEDNDELKMHIMDAKIAMAKEHRAALREVLLMGVTRLVVEKGEIEAGVEFSIKATRESKAHHDDQNINVVQTHMDYEPPVFGLFGGASGSIDVSNTNIQVNTSDKKATDDLSATLKGRVNIKFKTDYFKLDNFANMYADGGVAALKPPGAPGAPGQPPVPGR